MPRELGAQHGSGIGRSKRLGAQQQRLLDALREHGGWMTTLEAMRAGQYPSTERAWIGLESLRKRGLIECSEDNEHWRAV